MIRFKAVTALLLSGVMVLSVTGCSKVNESVASTSVAAAQSPREVLQNASETFNSYDCISSVKANAEFVINMDEQYKVSGSCKMDGFINDMKAKAVADISMNDKNTKYEVYTDGSSVVYSIGDEDGYKKIDLSKLSMFGMDYSEIFNQIQDYSDNDSTMQEGESSETETVDVKEMLDRIAEMYDIFTLDGTKKINGKEVYVLKATLDSESINSICKGMEEQTDLTTDIGSINIEIYVATSGYDIAGLYVDFSEYVKAITGAESVQENHMQIMLEVNSAENFDIPEAEDINVLEIMNDTSEISSLFGGMRF